MNQLLLTDCHGNGKGGGQKLAAANLLPAPDYIVAIRESWHSRYASKRDVDEKAH
ncbi:hypothetical protein [Rhizobium grahamii]|uniref:hypothetical protein n=1 Tax=Rhizobium grahamii TaxID=1120045 RepID=UPI00159ECD4F|nr:hypothetical protein [Rhizobium grahamii]